MLCFADSLATDAVVVQLTSLIRADTSDISLWFTVIKSFFLHYWPFCGHCLQICIFMLPQSWMECPEASCIGSVSLYANYNFACYILSVQDTVIMFVCLFVRVMHFQMTWGLAWPPCVCNPMTLNDPWGDMVYHKPILSNIYHHLLRHGFYYVYVYILKKM